MGAFEDGAAPPFFVVDGAARVAVGSLLIISFTFLFRGGFAFREFSYSRGVFALDFVLALIIFSAFHLGLRRLQTLVRARDINLIPTLIVGTNAEAEQTIRELQERTDLGYRVVGVIGDAETEISGFRFQVSGREGNGQRTTDNGRLSHASHRHLQRPQMSRA